MRTIKICLRGALYNNKNASIGIGALIIFIAMILVAGVTASVLLQTMNSLQNQALKTGSETINEISNGLKVTHVSGYYNGSKISQLAIFISTTAGSNAIDLQNTFVSLSETNVQTLLNYDSNCFSSTVSNGIFQTINTSNLSKSTFGIIVIRDVDNSCTSSNPNINENDLLALIVDTSKCFSGIDTRTKVNGKVAPESGMRGIVAFTTPSAFTNTIIDLQ